MIQVHFYSSKWYLPVGTLIKAKTNSLLSHVSHEVILNGEKKGLIRHSRMFGGVREDTKHYQKPSKTLILPFDSESEKGKRFLNILESKKNCGYDYLALFFGCWGKKIQNKDRYLCSEYVALYLTEYLNIVPDIKTIFVPKDLYLFLRGFLKGIKYAEQKG